MAHLLSDTWAQALNQPELSPCLYCNMFEPAVPRGMLPNEFSGMSWLRGQIREVMDSVWAAAQEWQPDIILANQLAYGQVNYGVCMQSPLVVRLPQ